MASNYTSNYNLNQWAASDKVLRTEFNADNLKIDAALAAKAENADLSALQTVVGQKADQSALDAVTKTLNQHGPNINLRNARYYIGSYQGAGFYGEDHPNTLTLPYRPAFLLVTSTNTDAYFCAMRGQETAHGHVYDEHVREIVTWGERTISWYNVKIPNSMTGATADRQFNDAYTTYFYFAVLQLS